MASKPTNMHCYMQNIQLSTMRWAPLGAIRIWLASSCIVRKCINSKVIPSWRYKYECTSGFYVMVPIESKSKYEIGILFPAV